MLKEMLADSPRDSTRAYNLLLNACAKARRWESAQSVFKVGGWALLSTVGCSVGWVYILGGVIGR